MAAEIRFSRKNIGHVRCLYIYILYGNEKNKSAFEIRKFKNGSYKIVDTRINGQDIHTFTDKIFVSFEKVKEFFKDIKNAKKASERYYL